MLFFRSGKVGSTVMLEAFKTRSDQEKNNSQIPAVRARAGSWMKQHARSLFNYLFTFPAAFFLSLPTTRMLLKHQTMLLLQPLYTWLCARNFAIFFVEQRKHRSSTCTFLTREGGSGKAVNTTKVPLRGGAVKQRLNWRESLVSWMPALGFTLKVIPCLNSIARESKEAFSTLNWLLCLECRLFLVLQRLVKVIFAWSHLGEHKLQMRLKKV